MSLFSSPPLLRITAARTRALPALLRLEGRLTDAEWEVLRRARMECQGWPLGLELSGLLFIDSGAAERLVAWRREGVALLGGSVFIREMLRLAEDSAQDSPPGAHRKSRGGNR